MTLDRHTVSMVLVLILFAAATMWFPWVGKLSVVASQGQATPQSAPCDVVLASGTPAVDHVATGQSAFDASSPEQAGQTGNAADYPFDLVFIDAMIGQHRGAVTMANIALARSERAEIRALATAIVATQSAEIAVLQGWRTRWYLEDDPVPANVVTGLTDEGMMTAGAAGGMGEGSTESDLGMALTRLCAWDGPFDLAFLEEMIPHHQGAMGMARLAFDRGEHPDLIALAKTIVASQEAELTLMTTWQAEWYPLDATGSFDGSDVTIEGTPTQ